MGHDYVKENEKDDMGCYDYASICYGELREGEIERGRCDMNPEERSSVFERELHCRIHGDHVGWNSS